MGRPKTRPKPLPLICLALAARHVILVVRHVILAILAVSRCPAGTVWSGAIAAAAYAHLAG